MTDATAENRFAEDLFPSLVISEGGSAPSHDELHAIVEDLAAAYLPDAICAYVHGSAVSGGYKAYSDIDVVFVVEVGAVIERRLRFHRNRLIDETVIPLTLIGPLLAKSTTSVEHNPLLGISAARLFCLDAAKAMNIRGRINKIYTRTVDLDTHAKYIDTRRGAVAAILLEISTSNDALQQKMLSLSLFDHFVALLQMARGARLCDVKTLVSEQRAQEPETLRELEHAFSRASAGDFEPVVVFGHALLTRFGPLSSCLFETKARV